MKATHTLKFGILSSLLVLASCQKEETTINQDTPVNSMEELMVSSTFNWSAGLRGKVKVTFQNPDNISVDREMLYLVDAEQNVLDKIEILGTSASFNVDLPSNGDFSVYFPYTNQSLKINGPGSYDLQVSNSQSGKRSFKSNTAGSCTVCASPIENNLAELPVIADKSFSIKDASEVPGWETTANDNKIEIWSDLFNGVPAQEGRQFFEINANSQTNQAIYQSLCLNPGSTVKWSLYHRGRGGVDAARVRIGGTVATATEQKVMNSGTSAWVYYSGTYVIPAGQTNTIFLFEGISTGSGSASIGNFLDNFRITCDEDGDGVVDADDDYPSDPTRAYRSFFPSAGTQTVAFEDLWPSTGDYDFNDLVLNQKVEISKNANNEWVDASFKIAVDAIGAGLNNGIGLLLRDESKQDINSSLIASVSGDAAIDADNTNGIIVSNDVFASISQYYQNNGSGPSKTADTLSFTVTFNAGFSSDIEPELYLYRTANRALEVHRPGYAGSSAFDANLSNTIDDNGDFKTATGLPWAIEIISAGDYDHPLEKVEMTTAFPQFQAWATSNGSQNTTWYDFPVAQEVFNAQN
jgi:LruC domain-containing protein